MTPRPARDIDAAAIDALLREAFGGAEEAVLVAALRAEGAVVVELVTEDVTGITGHILFSAAPIGATSAVALAPLSVASAARRQGVGAALVRDGLARCAAAGTEAAHVLGEPAYYARFGFRPAPDVTGAAWCGHPAFQAMALLPGAGLSGAVRYARAFGVLGAE